MGIEASTPDVWGKLNPLIISTDTSKVFFVQCWQTSAQCSFTFLFLSDRNETFSCCIPSCASLAAFLLTVSMKCAYVSHRNLAVSSEPSRFCPSVAFMLAGWCLMSDVNDTWSFCPVPAWLYGRDWLIWHMIGWWDKCPDRVQDGERLPFSSDLCISINR